MTSLHNPLHLIARKQLVGQSDTDDIALRIMIHFDAAKRGMCSTGGANFLATHLVIASYIASRTKSKAFHDAVVKAYSALKKASDRPTKLLDLTTQEYQAIRVALKLYLCGMPTVEVGTMADACATAERMMNPEG